ncbi:MAG: RNA polymerase sigma factor [Planctomycetaceae bacterium]
MAKTGDRQFSEDLTQETLLKVFDQAWDYLPTGRFRGWMFRIARNLLIDNFRRRSSDALIRAVAPGAEQESPLLGLAEELDSPLQKADQREIHQLVDQWLADFPEDQRLTFCLHHFLGLSLPEVAEILETNVATTKSRLRLAREKLREKLIHRGVLE